MGRMPHTQWIDPSWIDEPCSPKEADRRQGEMQGILDAINKVIGFDPNSPSAKAEALAQKNYSEAVNKAKLNYNYTMTQALQAYQKAQERDYRNTTAIKQIYDRVEEQATKEYCRAEEQAYKDYEACQPPERAQVGKVVQNKG